MEEVTRVVEKARADLASLAIIETAKDDASEEEKKADEEEKMDETSDMRRTEKKRRMLRRWKSAKKKKKKRKKKSKKRERRAPSTPTRMESCRPHAKTRERMFGEEKDEKKSGGRIRETRDVGTER